MANSKELTEQVMELHKKQTKEMKALEEQREEALKVEKYDEAAVSFTICTTAILRLVSPRNRHGS